MKKTSLILLAMIACALPSCKQEVETNESPEKPKVMPKETTLASDIMTPEVLWSMGRIGEYDLSPDGSRIVYNVTYYSVEENRSSSTLYIMNADGTDNKELTGANPSEYSPQWRPDGKKIGFLCAETGSMQLWEVNPDGTGRQCVSNEDSDINGFSYSPDGSQVLFCKEVKLKDNVADIYPDLPLSSGRINNDLMYRHWDQWVDTYSHLFLGDFSTGKIENAIDVMKGEQWESPVRPFGGMEQVQWMADGKSFVYCCRKKVGKDYALSTNTDIYQYTIGSGECKNLTEGMMGYDLNPVISPDGRYMAWESMERDGYESDKQRLFVMNLETGEKTDFSKDFDQCCTGYSWAPDSKTLYFISDHYAVDELYALTLADGNIRKITEGVHNYVSVAALEDKLIAGMQSMSHPTELFCVDPANGEAKQITTINDKIFAQLTMGKVEERWVKTTDGKDMLTWVIYPPHFDASKKYPALLYCEGGPQSTVSQFWSYRWNFQMMAANGYIVVAPNRRGLPGFGQEWLEEISGDYGGQCMKDYLSAIDELSKEPYIDENRLGAVGASFGGYSVYWLAGHHDGRFKALIAHDGMFNLDAQYLETEEMWFVNWDLGGPYWDWNNPTVRKTYANSPHLFVDKWTAPILVIHGGNDYRICFTQGMQAYNAAVLRGIDAEFLYFPDENHWVLKPQNGVLWQRRFYNWLDKYLK
ncbi:MAG: S9 family peptidase [Bacteroidales bacterium]|nr:S9 family peptidase [Bacteroidales bacterium]